MLTKEQLDALADTPMKPEPVATPLGTVYVRRMRDGEYLDLLDKLENAPRGLDLCNVVVNEYGSRVYEDKDAAKAARWPREFTQPIREAFFRVNGHVAKKDSAPTDTSSTGSPPSSGTPTPT